jgi:broad specificity phosphatase PhoE
MLLSPPLRPRALDPESEREPRASLGSEALLWLVRHGRVTARDIAYGDDDVPLSSDGETQTHAVAESFRTVDVTYVATSPLQRARAMGEAVARACGVPVEVDTRLAELHRGDWQGPVDRSTAIRYRDWSGSNQLRTVSELKR